MAKPAAQAQAIQLRIDEQLSLAAIASRLKVSKSSVSKWVRKYPLSTETLTARQECAINLSIDIRRQKRARREAERAIGSPYRRLFDGRAYTSSEKGKIAEAAVLLRLAMLQLEVYKSFFDGDKIDMIVSKDGILMKLQVRFARAGRHGNPYVSLQCSNGRKKMRTYTQGELDVLIGFDMLANTCHVFHFDEIKANRRCATCNKENAETWDKLETWFESRQEDQVCATMIVGR
ncbi:MAG: hypothetical protein JSS66_07175 [Armatimonadetes bacterium]|nr:hypothetical protein [Armatimonadota bacterium]